MYPDYHFQQRLIADRRHELQRIADRTHLRRIARQRRKHT
jgi:hypothetical protein